MDTYRDMGDRSVEAVRSVRLRCDACRVKWTGCAAAPDCPVCGSTEMFDALCETEKSMESYESLRKGMLRLVGILRDEVEVKLDVLARLYENSGRLGWARATSDLAYYLAGLEDGDSVRGVYPHRHAAIRRARGIAEALASSFATTSVPNGTVFLKDVKVTA